MNVLLGVLAMAVSGDPPAPSEPHQLPAEVFVDRTGLSEWIVGSGFNGAVVGTLVTRPLFSDPDSIGAVSGTVLGIGVGVLIPVLASGGGPVVPAQAALYNFGQRWGLVNGLLIPVMWGGREDWHFALSVTTLTAAGAVGAAVLWPRLEPTPGQISALGTFHAFTTIATSLVTVLFDLVGDGGPAFAAPVLLLSNASIGAAWVLRGDFDIDRRRVIWTDIGGYVGLAAGLAGGLLVVRGGRGPHREQILAAGMLGGMTGGLALGYGLSSGLDAFRKSAHPDRSEVTFELPGLRPLVVRTGGDAGTGWILDVVRARW